MKETFGKPTSHYLNNWWPCSTQINGVTRPYWVNSRGTGYNSPCSMPIWPIRFKFGTNISHERKMCHTPFLGQKVKYQSHMDHLKSRSQGLFGVFARVHYVVPCLFDWFALYTAQIQPMKWHSVAHNFQVKKSNVAGDIQNFCNIHSVARCLFDRFISYVAQEQSMLCTISRLKGQRSRSQGLFQVYVVSAP